MAPPKSPDEYRVHFFTFTPMGEEQRLLAVLGALRDAGYEPTLSGIVEDKLVAWDQEAVVKDVLSRESRVLYLARRKPPRYTGGLYAVRKGLASLDLIITSTDKAQAIYELGDRLAGVLSPLYGFVHPWFKGERDWNVAGGIQIIDFESLGPAGATARAYYGPAMVELLGRQRLSSSGVELTELASGCLRADLLAEPWTARFSTLRRRQEEVQKVLEPAGIFGDYGHPLRTKAGPNWRKPIAPGK